MRGPIRSLHPSLPVLHEVHLERLAQDQRWGQQDHPDVPPWRAPSLSSDGDGLPPRASLGLPSADHARWMCDTAAKLGKVTWAHILTEELCEAIDAPDPASRRRELVQLAAVAVAAAEAIDRRVASSPPVPTLCSAPGCEHPAAATSTLCEACWDREHEAWEAQREVRAVPTWPPPSAPRDLHAVGDLVSDAIEYGEAREGDIVVLVHHDGLMVGRIERDALVGAHGLDEEAARELVGLLQRSRESAHTLAPRWVAERASRPDLRLVEVNNG